MDWMSVAGVYGLPNLNKSGSDLSGELFGGEDLNKVINPGCYHGEDQRRSVQQFS